MEAFQQLRDHPLISKGDPTLVYYAGHGGCKAASSEWNEKYGYEEIQVIFPHDYNAPDLESKEVVNCIPDRTIGMLLNELAAVKGDNITVIFDSCHSTSGNRIDPAVPVRISRVADPVLDIPIDIDLDVFPANAVNSYYFIPPELAKGLEARRPVPPLYTDQASHIYFAACGSQEKAKEHNGRGDFTTALLKCIRASGVDKISYQNLMISLPMLPQQNPHCYGVHKSRILFNSRVPSRKVTFIPVTREEGGWVLQAGEASGVTFGSIWELHAKPTEDSEPLGEFEARNLKVSLADLRPKSDTADNQTLSELGRADGGRLYARQIRAGPGQELRVYFTPQAKQLVFSDSQVPSAVETGGYEVGYVVHAAPDSADLVVEVHHPNTTSSLHLSGAGTEVEYTICHPELQKYGLAKLRNRTRARLDEVKPVLFAAARWNWHLQRKNMSAEPEAALSINLLKLGRSLYNKPPPAEDLWGSLSTGIVEIVARDEDKYGIQLTNEKSFPLYLAAYYFDPNEFSIGTLPFFTAKVAAMIDILKLDHIFGHTQSNNRQDPDLPAKGKQITIGDGSDGGAALVFKLGKGVNLDVGFFKVFWSTNPLQLSDMPQGSVFEEQGVKDIRTFGFQDKPRSQ
ncbi:hypothetical protein FRC07_010978, partial [Ceratobasidium sp. 392]